MVATARGFLVVLALSIHDLFEGVALGVARSGQLQLSHLPAPIVRPGHATMALPSIQCWARPRLASFNCCQFPYPFR